MIMKVHSCKVVTCERNLRCFSLCDRFIIDLTMDRASSREGFSISKGNLDMKGKGVKHVRL